MKFSLFQQDKKQWIHSLSSLSVFIGIIYFTLYSLTHMPGNSFEGSLGDLSSEEIEVQTRLIENVRYLSEDIGARSISVEGSLDKSKKYLIEEIHKIGLDYNEQSFTAKNKIVYNIEVPINGLNEETIVIGAHYDTCYYGPGANDNASGVAGVLELLRYFKNIPLKHNFRFVFFVNEEPPFFLGEQMGSMVYAKKLKEQNIPVKAMISLETIAYFTSEKDSQRYPIDALKLKYPSTGNFLAFVGNIQSGDLVRKASKIFRDGVEFPSEGLSAPKSISGIGWSDHSSFWKQGYPAIM
ncbi:M20/M25/M40 family metallo-hydrolase, partial [bacterium]|nr:M20/M25/M40 family metallo-hydrolase [bacterium]